MASNHLCQPCETEDTFVLAIKWCTECEENLCKECFQFHRKGKATKNHHVLDISEASIFPTLETQHCSKHSEMLLDLFCVDHDSLSCRQCMTEDHRTCSKLLPLDVAAKHVHSSALVSDVVKDLGLSVVSFCSIETAIGKALREVDDQNIASNQSITTIKTRLQNQLAKSASVLSQEIDIICTEHRLRLQEQDHSFTESKAMYTKRQQELEKVLKHGSNNQVFIMAHQMKILLRKEEAAFINNCNKLNNIEIHFPEDQHISSIPSLDDISIEKIPLTIIKKFSNAQVADNVRHNDSVKKLYEHSSIAYESRPCIRGLAVTKENNLLMCHENESTVSKCSQYGNIEQSCIVGGQVFNICVIDETNTAVITLPSKNLMQFLKYLPMKVEKTVNILPNSLGITLYKDKLVVGGKQRIQFFTTDGRPINIVNVNLDSTSAISYLHPCDDRNRIYVSCESLYEISDNGKSVIKHSGSSIPLSHGIITDRDDNVYVASKNSIMRLSREGIVLNDNLLKTRLFGYDEIWALAFNRTYTLMYATTRDGYALEIFDFK